MILEDTFIQITKLLNILMDIFLIIFKPTRSAESYYILTTKEITINPSMAHKKYTARSVKGVLEH